MSPYVEREIPPLIAKELARDNPRVRMAKLRREFKEAKSLSKKEQIADEIVILGTVGSTDFITMAQAMEIGLSALAGTGNRDKSYGQRIVNLMGIFVDSRGITFKSLVDPRNDPDEEIRHLEQLNLNPDRVIHRLAKGRGAIMGSSLGIMVSAAKLVEEKPWERQGDARGCIQVVETVDPEIQGDRKFSRYKQACGEIIQAGWAAAGTPLLSPEKVIQAMKKAPSLRKIPSPYKRKFGGVSAAEIVNERDTETRALLLLKFMANVPEGDYLWREVVERVFLARQEVIPEEGEIVFSNRRLSQRIFETQNYLAEQLFFPPFRDELHDTGYPDVIPDETIREIFTLSESNQGLDEAFAEAIQHSSVQTRIAAAVALFAAATQGSTTRKILNPKATAFTFPPFALALSHRLTRDELQPSEWVVPLTDEETNAFLSDNWGRITQNWRTRFFSHYGENDGFQAFEKMMGVFVGEEYTPIHTQEIFNHIENALGTNFMDKLRQRSGELEEVSAAIISDVSPAYWPHPDVPHDISFSKDSLPEIMGLEGISFRVEGVEENLNRPVKFYLHTQNRHLTFTGILQGGKIRLSIDIEETHPGLKTLMDHVIISSFHDLLRREEIRDREKRREKAGEQQKKDVRSRLSDRIKGKRGKRQKSKARRWLPRRLRLVSGEDTAVLDSDAVKEEINREQEKRGFTPRKVDMHLRGVPYSRQYKQARKRYLSAPPEQKARAQKKLEEVRGKLGRPSDEKLKSLPPRFQLETVTDPVTHEEFVLQTWVIAHSSPRPTGEEHASPLTMYEKYYRRSSALEFLEYVKSWIVETSSASIS